MKRILTVVAAVTALAAISAAPAMASQAAPVQPAQPPQVARHQISISATCGPCGSEDANGQAIAAANSGAQFGVIGGTALFQTPLLGHVNSTWPFSDHRFDSLYAGDPVYQFQQTNGGGGCMQTDSVHSAVFDDPCGSHNAGTYWTAVGASARGFCAGGADWLVNVGITNHYTPYPYGYALFVNTNNLIYADPHRPISGDDQWCPF